MTRYLLDTNAVGDLINKRYAVDFRAANARRTGAIIGACEVVVAELYFGVEKSSTREFNLDRLNRAPSRLKCCPLTREASREFGRLLTLSSEVGTQIGRMDVLIAAIAMTLSSCIVVSKDQGLLRILA